MLDLALRRHHFFSVYTIDGKHYQDREAVSVKKLQQIFHLHRDNTQTLHHDVINCLRDFKRIVIDEPIQEKVGDWMLSHLKEIIKVEVKSHDIKTSYFLSKIVIKRGVDIFYHPVSSYPLEYSTLNTKLLDFDLLIDSLEHLERHYSTIAAMELFSSVLATYSGIEIGTSAKSPYFDWLIHYEKQFEGIFFSHLIDVEDVCLDKVGAFINCQKGLKNLSLPIYPLSGHLYLENPKLNQLGFLDALGASYLDLDSFAALFSHAKTLHTLYLPKIFDPGILDLIQGRLAELKTIGFRSPTVSLGPAYADFLLRMEGRIQSLLITMDGRLNLRLLHPSAAIKSLDIIDCVLEPHSTILTLGVLFPNLSRLTLNGTVIKKEEIACFKILYPHIILIID